MTFPSPREAALLLIWCLLAVVGLCAVFVVGVALLPVMAVMVLVRWFLPRKAVR